MAYFVATLAMVIAFIASWVPILAIGWIFVYGDNGPTQTALIIEFAIAGGVALSAFFVTYKVCTGIRNARARRVPDQSSQPTLPPDTR